MRRSLPNLLLLSCALSCSACAMNPADTDADPSAGTLESPLSYPDTAASVRFESDRVRQDTAGTFLEVTFVARDLGPGKSAGIRAQVDGGSWSDAAASLVESAGGGWDRWRVSLRPAAGWVRAEYAIFVLDGKGGSYWSNNSAHNFVARTDAVVHRTSDKLESGKLSIELDVQNLAYEKQCSAAVTGDGWVSVNYFNAGYVGQTSRPGFEAWRLEIDLANSQSYGFNGKAASYEYAVSCSMAGASYWDNNNSTNFRRDRVTLPVLDWKTDFSGAAAVAVAGDGTTFVLSSGRWISGYSSTGQWLFAKQAPADLTALTWLESSGLLVGRAAGGNASVTWVALDKQGAQQWSTNAALTELVRGTGADYLVGLAGGARIDKTSPNVIAPAGGCHPGNDTTGSTAFPIVSRSGRMFCLDAASKIRSYDLATGAPGVTYPEGWPWAASDAGSLVVVSTDRTSLIGYSPSGQEKWRKKNLYVGVDTQYGSGTVCANHAHGDVAVFLNQLPGGGTVADHYVSGIDVATGNQAFKNLTSSYTQSPCAAADGAFYYRPGYEHYGRTFLRVDKTGVETSVNLGLNGQFFGIFADGRILRRDWAYYPNDKGRVVVSNGKGEELFNASFFDGQPSTHLAALQGDHLVVVEAGKVNHFRFAQ
ncbi:MAG: hypothetical protein HY898_11625 [Deltaproteobacteria bacterium]|nr:hypothetical protein [Deltaproteobacteria bacterium]